MDAENSRRVTVAAWSLGILLAMLALAQWLAPPVTLDPSRPGPLPTPTGAPNE